MHVMVDAYRPIDHIAVLQTNLQTSAFTVKAPVCMHCVGSHTLMHATCVAHCPLIVFAWRRPTC
jgi:hypothetical protein